MNRPRRATRLVNAVGMLLVLAGIPGTAAGQEPAAFVGYQASASGAAFTAAPSLPAVLPFETPVEGTVSLALATLSSGGQGFGRASTVWPGSPFVGIRPLIEIASGERLPIPDYPVVVESREFEDPKNANQPGMTMATDADPDRATATADFAGFAIDAVASFGSARTVSEVALEAGSLRSSVTTVVNGIDIAGGVLHIDSVETASTASTDSVASTCGGSVTVTGAMVGPTPVTIDQDGVHSGDNALVPGLPAASPADVLAASGITVRTLGGTETCGGAEASRSTAGLLVSLPLPELGAIPPGGHFDIVIGATAVTVGAGTTAAGPVASPAPDVPPVLADVVLRPVGPAAGSATAPVAVQSETVPPAESAPFAAPEVERLTYSFAGVSAPLVGALLLAGVAGARRVRRYMQRLFTMLVGQ